MEVVIVKYNAGNVQSVLFALDRLGVQATVTDDSEKIRSADKVIFPGVGEASTAMNYLRKHGLDQVISNLQQPVLGICLGMQLMCSFSEENDTTCLGIFDEPVRRFQNPSQSADVLKIPQIGWNSIYDLRTPLFQDISEGSHVYLVHSYHAALGEHTIATSDYISPYSAALHRDNFYGVQFHPEKSAETGARLISNFLAV